LHNFIFNNSLNHIKLHLIYLNFQLISMLFHQHILYNLLHHLVLTNLNKNQFYIFEDFQYLKDKNAL